MLIVCAFHYADVVSDGEDQTTRLLRINGGHTVELPTTLFIEIVLTYVYKKTIRSNIR